MAEITVNDFYFTSSDGSTQISVREWIPEGELKGIVQISHGVSEHKERYDGFARFLCENGYGAVANDHLGHGGSTGGNGTHIYFGEKDGWLNVADDTEKLRSIEAGKYAGVPYFLFGHSMGSFIVRTHLIRYPDSGIKGVVICGTGSKTGLILAIGKSIATGEIKKHGAVYISDKLINLSFGSYNKKINNPVSANAWLSVDEDNVRRYDADPLCGEKQTAGLVYDMMCMLEYIGKKSNMRKMKKDLPVFFIAGGDDPVGNYGKDVEKVSSMFIKLGMPDVMSRIYDGYRHEILNESEIRDTVMNDILEWLDVTNRLRSRE